MSSHLKASTTAIMDLHVLAEQNQNPLISHYRQGYEGFFNHMPVIQDSNKPMLEGIMETIFEELTAKLADEKWVRNNAPVKRQMLRTVLAMEAPKCTGEALEPGAELLVVNWKPNYTFPAHGHARGYMYETLIFGKMRHVTYRIIDAVNKIVRPIKVEIFCNSGDVIDAGYNEDHDLQYGAYVHNFTFLEPSATLNLVPGHPRDTKGNIFTIEEFQFKHINFQLEGFVPIKPSTTLQLPPGEVILVRSNTTKDLGDHFYVITDRPKQKRAGIRPVGQAIQASSDFSKLLDTIEAEGDVKIMRLMPTVRDWFLEWHGIQVQKNIIFPQP